MPLNRNALIRYKTIDQCLQNRFRKWTLLDLMEACSDALYEYEGIDKGVSKRTLQLDIQTMRSDKLGYNAPIVVKEKKYYTYAEADYSITKIPLSTNDLKLLKDVVSTLEQFKSFAHFEEFGGIVKKLEDQLNVKGKKSKPIIHFERNNRLRGIEYIDTIYKAIFEKKSLEIGYRSFKARSEHSFVFHPQFLKEYNNRWFVIGVREKSQHVLNLALDRIQSLKDSKQKYSNLNLNPDDYYQDIIGVTVSKSQRKQKVLFYVNRANAPYVITKPMHSSQKVFEERSDGIIFQLEVQINFELERLLLGYGANLVVLGPRRLRNRIRKNIEKSYEQYKLNVVQ